MTTSDAIQKLLTVIFGFKGYHEIEVGEIQGIGRLSAHHTDGLIKETLEFLHDFDMVLQEFAGCQLYSIEFELNQYEKQSDTKIMPKSMFFIPGIFKNSQSLLLLLAPQLSLMETQKPKDLINYINKILYEIEEVLDVEGLTHEQRHIILQKFAHRFTLKLQAEVIETKWNRKLVGLRDEVQDMSYLTLNLESRRNWSNREITVINPRFGYPRMHLSEEDKFEFAKYSINPSIAYIIAQKSFQLGANLLKIANTGTTDDTQKSFLVLFLNIFQESVSQSAEKVDFDQFNSLFKAFLVECEGWIKEFEKRYLDYINIIALKSMKEIEDDYNSRFHIDNNSSLKEQFIFYLGLIFINHMKNFRYSFQSYNKIRVAELQTPLLYINEAMKDVLQKISRLYRYYIQYFYYDAIIEELMQLLYRNLFTIEKQSILILGEKYLVKFKNYLSSEYELKSKEKLIRNQVHLLMEFKQIAKTMIEPFIQTASIDISDLLDYCNRKFSELPEFVIHIKKLATFTEEIEFIWGLILRNSTFQQFLKYFPDDLEFNPINFGTEFINFLQQGRIAAFNLNWRDIIYGYISDIIAPNQVQYDIDKENGVIWPKNKIISLFIESISNRVKKETTVEGFIEPMKTYIDKHAIASIQNRDLVKIYQTYIEGLEILDQFPDYLRQIFYVSIENLTRFNKYFPISEIVGPLRSMEEIMTFEMKDLRDSFATEKSLYGYVVGEEMKYFSSLLPFPLVLNLHSLNTSTDGKTPLTHKLEFQNLRDKFVKMTLSTNFTGKKIISTLDSKLGAKFPEGHK
ncbi:MAG: hypothetical protein ACTSYU_07900 [Promethearchaeota archaeon]